MRALNPWGLAQQFAGLLIQCNERTGVMLFTPFEEQHVLSMDTTFPDPDN